MKDKRWIFSIVDNEKKQSIPVKATIKTKTQDEAPKDLSDKDLEKLSAILAVINDKNLDAVVEFIKGIKPEKKEDEGKNDESDAGKKAAKDEQFDINEFSIGSEEEDSDTETKTEVDEQIVNTENKDSVMHDSKKSFGSLLTRTTDSKPEVDIDAKWQEYYNKRNKED